MDIKSLKLVFGARLVRLKLCMVYAFFLFVFVQKSFLTKNYFLTAEINLTTLGPLYTCLVAFKISDLDAVSVKIVRKMQTMNRITK